MVTTNSQARFMVILRFSSCGRCTCFGGGHGGFVVVAFGLQIKRYPIQVRS